MISCIHVILIILFLSFFFNKGSSGLNVCTSSIQQQRIHSSADEISSLNHSPSISSSDESFSRTTDADLSPSPSPSLHGDQNAKQWLYPSDIQVCNIIILYIHYNFLLFTF